MSWQLKQKAQKRLAAEKGTIIKPEGLTHHVALAYPNTYQLAMSNLGYQTIYDILNTRPDTFCERVFIPEQEDEQEYIRTNTKLFSLETQRTLNQFELIGFSISFELDYINILKILDMGGVPLLASERGEQDPIIMAGGPIVSCNPEPLTDFVDFFMIGEGEEMIQEAMDIYHAWRKEGKSKNDLFEQLLQVKGVYVPSFYKVNCKENGMIQSIDCLPKAPVQIERRWIKNLDAYDTTTRVITNDTVFSNMFLVELSRGCGRHCRFCMAGYCYRPPRVRSLDKIVELIEKGVVNQPRIGLVSAAVSDYPDMTALTQYLIAKGIKVSVSSLRADSLQQELVDLLAASGQRTLTLAPEAGSQRLRDRINKCITEEDIFKGITMAAKAGIPNIRLYFIIGFPSEEMDDLVEMVSLVQHCRERLYEASGKKTGKVTLSINPFIPKPVTPFQWVPMEKVNSLDKKITWIRGKLAKEHGIEVITESNKWSAIQALLARGDRQLGRCLVEVYREGKAGNFGAWKKALKAMGRSLDFYVYRERSMTEIFPWAMLMSKVNPEYLMKEYEKSLSGEMTAFCDVQHCKRCGVCK